MANNTLAHFEDVPTLSGLDALAQGAPLDARIMQLLQQVGAMAAAVPPEQLTVAKRRSLMLEAGELFKPLSAYSVSSQGLTIPLPGRELPARLYEPQQLSSDTLLVYFHGGGWVAGDLQTHHQSCQFLAHHLGMKLLSVQYRKSPEHVFPAPCDDAIEALAWAHERRSQWASSRIAISGDSAGGHLAAVAMYALPELVSKALLFYPVTDVQFMNPSYSERGAGVGLTKDTMVWYWQQFLASQEPEKSAHAKDPRAVPMLQSWAHPAPPTVIIAAWHDPLYEEAVTYAQHLLTAGGRVIMQHAADMPHGFVRHVFVSVSARSHVLAAVHAFAALD